MSHGHSANNFMDTIANQPNEHQGAAVDVGSGPLLGGLSEAQKLRRDLATTKQVADQLAAALHDADRLNSNVEYWGHFGSSSYREQSQAALRAYHDNA